MLVTHYRELLGFIVMTVSAQAGRQQEPQSTCVCPYYELGAMMYHAEWKKLHLASIISSFISTLIKDS